MIGVLQNRLFCYASARRLLSPYLDQELDAQRLAGMKQHLQTCSRCQNAYQQMVFARRAVGRISLPDQGPPNLHDALPDWISGAEVIPSRTSSSSRVHWVPITAAVGLVVLLMLGVWLMRPSRVPTPLSIPELDVVRLSGEPSINDRKFTRFASLRKGDRLATDAWSTALIKFGHLGQIEAEYDTQLELVETSSTEQRLSLKRGKIYASINAPPRLFFVDTPAGTAIDMGCAYSLEVDDKGESLLEVVSGWVALNLGQREELVPAGVACRARPGKGPGTPFLKDASAELQQALKRFDFDEAKADRRVTDLQIILNQARQKDAITLLHLLRKVESDRRAAIFERLTALVPLPANVSRAGILNMDEKMLEAWREPIEYASLGIDPRTIQFDRGTLRPTGSLNEVRFGHTTTLLPNGTLLVAGGMAKEGLATAEIYNPASETFALTGTMTHRRIGHTATLLATGKVLITGGSEFDPFEGAQSTAELFDPASGTFTATGSMNYPRLGHSATLLKDGKVLITGGILLGQTDNPTAEIYDPATGTFKDVGRMVYPRFDHTATLMSDGRVLIAGGARILGKNIDVMDQAEIFDPARLYTREAFRSTGSMQVGRHKHSALTLPSGQVLILGGTDINLWRGTMASAEVYDPASGSFSRTGQMSSARYKMRDAVVALANGKILVAGGGERVEIYDPDSGIFTPVPGTIGAARYLSTATRLPNGNVVIIGGYSAPPDKNGIRLLADAGAWIFAPTK